MDVQNLSPDAPLVVAADVRKHFGPLEVLKGINVKVQKGEVLCIIGPSGSGKSTFLRCINQLERIDGGAIWVGGELVGFRREGNNLHELDDAQIARQRRSIGMVFQRFNLFPHLTVTENIIEGPVQVLKENRNEARDRAHALLDRVGLIDKRDVYPAHLSGGQQQRVAIARAIVTQPDVLVADEPTGNLDSQRSVEIMELLTDLNKNSGITVLMVTHEPDMAAFARTIVHFRDGLVESIEAGVAA